MEPISFLLYIIVGLILLAIVWYVLKALALPPPIPMITILLILLLFVFYFVRTFGLL